MPIRDRSGDFLELLRRARRGRLKVYVGSAAGVGKTYRMLEEAHRLTERGVDVVVGYVDTRGRPDTEALLQGLVVVPRRVVAYRGVEVAELDTEAVIARRPDVAIVDDLAHTNVPGSRRSRRYEDVLDLLEAGISVIGAMNVQNLASLNDVVRRFTGIVVRETVPDSFLWHADQLVNLDISVDDLLERLRTGKIRPEGEEGASFVPENIETLRELALREVADALDRRKASRREAPRAEKLMVGLAPDAPTARSLLHRAARMAGRLNTHWYVVHVARPGARRDEPAGERAAVLLGEARELGAEVVRLEHRDVVAALVAFAADHAVRHVVLGRSRHRGWRLRADVIGRLLDRIPDADVHVIACAADRPAEAAATASRARVPEEVG